MILRNSSLTCLMSTSTVHLKRHANGTCTCKEETTFPWIMTQTTGLLELTKSPKYLGFCEKPAFYLKLLWIIYGQLLDRIGLLFIPSGHRWGCHTGQSYVRFGHTGGHRRGWAFTSLTWGSLSGLRSGFWPNIFSISNVQLETTIGLVGAWREETVF